FHREDEQPAFFEEHALAGLKLKCAVLVLIDIPPAAEQWPGVLGHRFLSSTTATMGDQEDQGDGQGNGDFPHATLYGCFLNSTSMTRIPVTAPSAPSRNTKGA